MPRTRPLGDGLGLSSAPLARRHFLGGLLAGIGGAVGGLGSFLGAKEGNKAGSDALGLYDSRTMDALMRSGYLNFGPQFMDIMRASLPGEVLTDTQKLRDLGLPVEPNREWYGEGDDADKQYQRDVDEFTAKQRAIQGALGAIGGKSLYDQQRDLSEHGLSQGTNILYGGGGQGALGGRGGLLGNINRAIGGQKKDIRQVRAGYNNLLGDVSGFFGNARGQVGDAYRRAEGEARGWAQGREGQIREDSAEALKNQNQLTQAAMGGLGANTLVGNQLQQNAQQNQRETSRALTDLGAARTDRVMGAQLSGADALRGLFGQEGALSAGIGSQRQGAMERMRGGLQGLRMQKAGSMYGAEQALLAQQLGLMGAPLGMAGGFTQSGQFNPFLGHNTSQYFPGYSPGGSAANALGGGLGSLGTMMMLMPGGGGS